MEDKRILDKAYWDWRNAVIKRDKGKCQYPGCRCRKRLHVHHIIRWADCYDLRYSIKNAILICKKHHLLVTGNETLYSDLFMTIVKSKDKK